MYDTISMNLRFSNKFIGIFNTIFLDLESHPHLHQFNTLTTINIYDLVVNRENPEKEAGHKDTDNNSKSTTKIEPAMIGIILLTIVSLVIALWIICTHSLEKYQSTKYTQLKYLIFNERGDISAYFNKRPHF